MIRLKFKCRFLSDIILNAHTATEGNQKTLDYIPGSNFLGITAGILYKSENEETFDIFHSSKVRFNNAYPWSGKERALPVPFCFYLPKGNNITDPESDIYIIHAIPNKYNIEDIIANGIQLKQIRSGYMFPHEYRYFKPGNTFKIKSAQDRIERKSKDAQMFGYESLEKDLEWQFSVDMDTTDHKDSIIEALVGIKRLGRSKTAEYGLVEISFQEEENITSEISIPSTEQLIIYAESDLCFLDKYGQPTITPTAQDFGFPQGFEIRYDKSQIRSRMYAPYNFKRKTRECDRLIIQKGSVFIIEGKENKAVTLPSDAVGLYRNEGFGQCIFNPHFIQADPISGKLSTELRQQKNQQATKPVYSVIEQGENDTLLLNWLAEQYSEIHLKSFRNKWIEDFLEKHKYRYSDVSKSQWGEIRSKAETINSPDDLFSFLFDKNNGYIMHGQRSKDWAANGGHEILSKEICRLRNRKKVVENPSLLCQIIKLLAIEMQK